MNVKTDANVIEINESVLKKLSSTYELQTGNLLKGEALQQEIDKYIKEEIYYQKALNLNLDKEDAVIRRILKNKYEFIIDNQVENKSYSEEELMTYYTSNAANYIADSTIDFYQVLFTNDQYKNAFDAALAMLENIQSQKLDHEEISKMNSNNPFDFHYEYADSKLITKTFGSVFTPQLFQAEIEIWTGPIKSGMGFHLVFIKDKQKIMETNFEKVRSKVLRDFLYQAKIDNEAAIYNKELKKYKIEYDNIVLEKLNQKE